MGKIFLFIVVAMVLAAPKVFAEEKFLEIYTFKKDRVDQEIDGNRGYISGKAPEAVEKPRKTQRTLIGVDIQIGVDNSDSDSDDVATPVRTQKRKSKKRVKKPKNSIPVTNKSSKVEKAQVKNKVLIVEETEDNWIK